MKWPEFAQQRDRHIIYTNDQPKVGSIFCCHRPILVMTAPSHGVGRDNFKLKIDMNDCVSSRTEGFTTRLISQRLADVRMRSLVLVTFRERVNVKCV